MAPSDFARVFGAVFLVALTAIVLVQLFAGRVNTRGLFSTKGIADDGTISPSRAQLLITTLTFAVLYVQDVAATGALREVSREWLAILGASHVTYLGSKAWAMRGRARPRDN